MSHHHMWETIKLIYLIGFCIAILFTFFMSKDRSLLIRFLASTLIALTWPLSFPVVIVFSFF
ncbi:GhoT/OrtT family toxin [Musicola keenii]|uniref:GhoT/OrtT family toxin n=1 Tax=Musicola keenii TaxID=2884250 RepID=UPI001785AA2D